MWNFENFENSLNLFLSLNSQNTELFQVAIFLYSVQIQENTDQK